MCFSCPCKPNNYIAQFFFGNNNPYRRIEPPSIPATPATSSMPPAAPVSMPYHPSGSQLSIQHERLILELLPFKDPPAFHSWLSSDYVRGSWNEFRRDGLYPLTVPAGSSRSASGGAEPDKQKTAQAARDALNSRKPKYLVYHPDKSNWTLDDHHIRFIVTVVADNMLQGLWSESEWKKRGVEVAKSVYEVLVFLKAIDVVDKEPPRYSA